MGDTIIQKIRQTDIDDIERVKALIKDGEETLNLHKRAEEEQANDKDLVTNNFELYQARRRTIQIYKKLTELSIASNYIVSTSLKRCADDNLKKDAKHNDLSNKLDRLEETVKPFTEGKDAVKSIFGKGGLIAVAARLSGNITLLLAGLAAYHAFIDK